MLIFPDTPLAGARVCVERIRCRIESEANTSHPECVVTISAGVAEWQPDEELESLLVRADRQLYKAKEAGRNRVFLDE